MQALAADPTVEFIICKATQGLEYVSSLWPASKDAAGAKYLGAYHYCEDGHDPIAEADHFLTTAQPTTGHLVVLDVERPVTPEFVLSWLDYVGQQTGATPLVYSNWKWIPPLRTACSVEQWERLVTFPAFLAENAEPGKNNPIDPKPGTEQGWPVMIHQYGVVDGIDRDYAPDVSALRGMAVP